MKQQSLFFSLKKFLLPTFLLKIVLLLPIRFYRYLLSPLLPRSCRFYPSCSRYAEEAILRFGPIKGSWMAIKRIARCNPWNEGGYDPVPQLHDENHVKTEQQVASNGENQWNIAQLQQ